MVVLCPQGTAIDNVDVPIYPLLGVTRNTQLLFFNTTIRHPMCHTLSCILAYLLHYYIGQKGQRRLKLSKISAYMKIDKW